MQMERLTLKNWKKRKEEYQIKQRHRSTCYKQVGLGEVTDLKQEKCEKDQIYNSNSMDKSPKSRVRSNKYPEKKKNFKQVSISISLKTMRS